MFPYKCFSTVFAISVLHFFQSKNGKSYAPINLAYINVIIITLKVQKDPKTYANFFCSGSNSC